MKKYVSCFLILTLALSLFSGCSSPAPAPSEPAPTKDAAAQPIRTAEALVEALGSGRELTLEPVTYDLTTILTDGKFHSRNEKTGALWITGLNGLTIHGNGAELLVDGAQGMPLVFDSCRDLHLEDLTITHKDPQVTASDSLLIHCCQDVDLQNITFRDSAASLLTVQGSENCKAENCLFTGASGTAVSIEGSTAVTVENCKVQELGLPETREKLPHGMPDFSALISVSDWSREEQHLESKDITIENNRFSDNTSGLLAFVSNSRKVTLTNNEFTGNHIKEAAFCIWTAQPHIYGNTYRDNDPWLWYYPSSAMAVDENGVEIPSELFAPEVELPKAGQQKEVHAASADEFLAAIGPDTRILLDCSLLDLSTASDYGTGKTDYYRWDQQYDGPVLVISGVNNLTIAAEEEDRTAHTISALPRYADVLSFEFCTNLTLQNLTCGHTVEPGFCMGGVLRFKECSNVKVCNCGLYGCGILGVIAHGGENLQILDSDIYECSDGGVALDRVNGVTIENTTFRDLGGEALHVTRCKDASIDGQPIPQK